MRKKILGVISFFLLCLQLQAQEESFKSQLMKYVVDATRFNLLYPQESVYLHFDNTGYYAGETIWFKAYVISSTDDKLTQMSKVLHVELLGQNGELVEARKLKIENGQCHGEFALDKEIASGFYEVRAYTRCMLNFDDIIFSRVFPVYQKPEVDGNYAERIMEDYPRHIEQERPSLKKQDKVNLDFYPEGGNSVVGLQSKIAVKATGNRGQSIDVSGTIYDESGQEITTFSTLHRGMGVFDLTPESNRYTVKIDYEGKQYKFDLPSSLPSGYVMNVNNMDTRNLYVDIKKTSDLSSDSIGLCIMNRGKVCFFGVLGMESEADNYLLQLAKSDLPSGCLQITAFDRSGRVLSERLAFISPQSKVNMKIDGQKPRYAAFEEVNLNFDLSDEKGVPVETSFSLSVRDASTSIGTGYEDNIQTDLLLSSEIRGHVENPSYYFEKDDAHRRHSLDLLMMTQGWRRYNWEQMAGLTPFEVKHHIEDGIIISGEVVSIFRKKIQKGVDVKFWMIKDGASFQGLCKTDEAGKFNFLLNDSANAMGSWSLGLQTTEKGKGKSNKIMLDRVFSPKSKSYLYNDTYITEDITLIEHEEDSLYVPSITQIQVLPEFVVKKRIKKSNNLEIVYHVREEIDKLIDQDKSYPENVGYYLMKKNRRFQYDEFSCIPAYYGVYIALIYGLTESKDWGAGDKYAHYGIEKDIEEVDKIVIEAGVKYDPMTREYYKIIRVYPRNNLQTGSFSMGVRHTRFDGYSYTKDFFHVEHKEVIPGDVDYRRTLYWNPNVQTDSQGKASVKFYNNSIGRHIAISAEGLTKDGVPIVNSIETNHFAFL